jgi:hypothetical protein
MIIGNIMFLENLLGSGLKKMISLYVGVHERNGERGAFKLESSKYLGRALAMYTCTGKDISNV